MHVDAASWLGARLWDRTAAMRWSEGGEEESCVVARITATRILEWRLVGSAALIREVLSLRKAIKILSFLLWPIWILQKMKRNLQEIKIESCLYVYFYEQRRQN